MESLAALRERRAYECRLTPGRALGSLDEAEGFLRDRGMLTRTTDSALYGTLAKTDLTSSSPALAFQFQKVLTAWNPTTSASGTLSTMMADLDRNGVPELFYLEGHDPTYYRGTEQAYRVDATGAARPRDVPRDGGHDDDGARVGRHAARRAGRRAA